MLPASGPGSSLIIEDLVVVYVYGGGGNIGQEGGILSWVKFPPGGDLSWARFPPGGISDGGKYRLVHRGKLPQIR